MALGSLLACRENRARIWGLLNDYPFPPFPGFQLTSCARNPNRLTATGVPGWLVETTGWVGNGRGGGGLKLANDFVPPVRSRIGPMDFLAFSVFTSAMSEMDVAAPDFFSLLRRNLFSAFVDINHSASDDRPDGHFLNFPLEFHLNLCINRSETLQEEIQRYD